MESNTKVKLMLYAFLTWFFGTLNYCVLAYALYRINAAIALIFVLSTIGTKLAASITNGVLKDFQTQQFINLASKMSNQLNKENSKNVTGH